MLELWLVVLNVIDYVKDFLSGEFRTALARYHQDALTAYSNVLDPPMGAIDWPRLERVLTHDVRQTKRIAVLGTASEFQFYSYAADYRERIFFMMDIRDLGVVLALCLRRHDRRHRAPQAHRRELDEGDIQVDGLGSTFGSDLPMTASSRRSGNTTTWSRNAVDCLLSAGGARSALGLPFGRFFPGSNRASK